MSDDLGFGPTLVHPSRWRTLADIDQRHRLAGPVRVIFGALRCQCPPPYDDCPHDNPLPDAVRIALALRKAGHLL
jgi:hypothetical protein